MDTRTAMRSETGKKCETEGMYEFDGYTDGKRNPAPTAEERRIALSRGETFPPIRSANKACHWRLVGTA